MLPSHRRWQFWIDRGGTFTDCLGRDPADGQIRAIKVLSSDTAPLEAIRHLLGLPDSGGIPPCDVRMGTTVATNALLQRTGTACALVITKGFEDILDIANQTRPDLSIVDDRVVRLPTCLRCERKRHTHNYRQVEPSLWLATQHDYR